MKHYMKQIIITIELFKMFLGVSFTSWEISTNFGFRKNEYDEGKILLSIVSMTYTRRKLFIEKEQETTVNIIELA